MVGSEMAKVRTPTHFRRFPLAVGSIIGIFSLSSLMRFFGALQSSIAITRTICPCLATTTKRTCSMANERPMGIQFVASKTNKARVSSNPIQLSLGLHIGSNCQKMLPNRCKSALW